LNSVTVSIMKTKPALHGIIAAALLQSCSPEIPAADAAIDQTLTTEHCFRLMQSGRGMTPQKFTELTTRAANNPADHEAVLPLIGYHGRGDKLKPEGSTLLLGFIQRHPRAEGAGGLYIVLSYLYDIDTLKSAVRVWEEHAARFHDEPQVLGNAAQWMQHLGAMEPAYATQAVTHLERARSLDPSELRWALLLGMTSLDVANKQKPPQSVATAKQAIIALEASLTLGDAAKRDLLLSGKGPVEAALAEARFITGDFIKAKADAETALTKIDPKKDSWNHGNLFFNLHQLLGRIALAQGDMKEAAAQLIASGKTPGSPQLNSFGPGMSLALELLGKGERAAVIEYLDLCAKFWSSGRSKLPGWKAQIEKGETPDFGPNTKR
jgi:tetratricopeptide (TPR) repeat protein